MNLDENKVPPLGSENPAQPDPSPAPKPTPTPEPTPVLMPTPAAPAAAQSATPAVASNSVNPAPASGATGPTPAAATPAPAPKKVLTPEEKKAKRKASLKRLAIVSAGAWLLIVLGIVAWTFLVGQEPVGLLSSLGISQQSFNAFLMTLFNVFFGALVLVLLGLCLVSIVRSLMMKKELLEQKKKMSKRGMLWGVAFLAAAILWLLGILFMQPILKAETFYDSYIDTIPEDTIGLTAPVEVIFDATGIPIDPNVYTILSYSWTFGDGGTATGAVVTHRYTEKGSADGRYTVFLDVDYMDIKSGEQFEAEFSTEVVIANEQVAASFVASPEAGELPLEVTFDASSSTDPDGQIVSYEWDLDGDGRFDDGEGEVVTYTYTQEGEFEVTLQVTDNNGEVNTSSMIIEAGSVGGLRAVITSTVPQGSNYILGEEYNFSAESSQIREGSISKYTWDFGDGEEQSGKNVSHTYEEEGNYTIVLTVTDAQGNEDKDEVEITVVDEGSPPEARISTDPVATGDTVTGVVPLTVEFNGESSVDPDDDIVEYEWDFDMDGLIDETGSVVNYTFSNIGDYEVGLRVTDSAGNEAETIINVEVTEQGVVARLEVDKSNGEVPLTVTFDASGSTYNEGSIVAYEYDFGDGNKTTGGSTVSYKYKGVGTFSAKVTVLGADGNKDTATVQIVVRPVSLTACFTVNTDNGRAPLFITVDPSCSQGTIEDYHWDFGDGDVSFDRKPETHVYSSPGTYEITLEITSDTGLVSEFSKSVTVR